MDSLNQHSNENPDTGNELNAALEAESDPIIDELISELTDESDDQFSGDELDEALDDESETVLEETEPAIEDQSDDQFSDSELDEAPDKKHDAILEEIESVDGVTPAAEVESESVDGVTPAAEVESESLPKEGRLKGLAKILKKKKKLSIFLATGLLLLAGIGCFYGLNTKKETPSVDNFTAPALATQSPEFDLFVIPLKAHDKFTYVSLSIAFDLANDKLKSEFIQKKVLLRGIIYDILNQEINRVNEIPPVEDLKKFIIKEVNHVLANGAVNRAYIMNFLAV